MRVVTGVEPRLTEYPVSCFALPINNERASNRARSGVLRCRGADNVLTDQHGLLFPGNRDY